MDTPSSSQSKRKILLVEDDEFLNEIYSVKFSAAGFDFASAKNGKQGLEKAKEFKPDLALIDLIMPEMDGYTMLEKLRQDTEIKDTKVIILTNVIPDEGIERVARLGILDYVVKSDMSASNLVDKISKILHQPQ